MVIWRLIKKLIKIAVVLVLFIAAIPLGGLAYGFWTTSPIDAAPLPGTGESGAPPKALADQVRAEIPAYQRPEESTFLTYPEWAIVYAAREYADFLKAGNRESGFPYWSYIGRFWQDYAMVIRASEDYPFNFANHQMLTVIGTSHTIEHGIQWAYENTVGRITEWISGKPVAVDRYQANVAGEYAAFLDQVPWYQFPYSQKRTGLFATQPDEDDSAIRTWERRAQGGLAYTIKQSYANLITSALAATADAALLDIHVWAAGINAGDVARAIDGEADTKLEKDFGSDGAVFVTKRYQVFTDMIPRLIEKGQRFVEIGGNDEILMTVLTGADITPPPGARKLFSYPLPADPARHRQGLTVAVRHLHTVVPALISAGAKLEHVYDY